MVSETDLRHLEAAQRVLLHPNQDSTLEEWLESSADAIARLMHADAVHAFAPQEGAPVQAGACVDPGFFEGVDAFFAQARDGNASERAAMQLHLRMQQTRVAGGAGVYHDTDLADRHSIEASPFYQDVCAPHGIQYTTGLSIPWRDTEAAFCVSFTRPDAPGYDPTTSVLLRLLIPAFEVGLSYWTRLVDAADQMRASIDALPVAAALFDADGTELHRNRALCLLLDSEPAADRIAEAAETLAHDVNLRPRKSPRFAVPQQDVDGAEASFRMRACLLQLETVDAPFTLVTVEHLSLFPPQQVVQNRLGLTAREAEVAILVARGASNADLADQLYISPHTARHHVARILKKLDLSSRSGIASALLRARIESDKNENT
jgi:DNA-binding CsgD family transcriptional regulator